MATLIRGTAEGEYLPGDDYYLSGLAGDQRIEGLGGDDLLYGGAGRDRLIGGTGNDFLTGGLDRDVLIGGAGADEFSFSAAGDYVDSVFAQADLITDFGSGDRIILYIVNDGHLGGTYTDTAIAVGPLAIGAALDYGGDGMVDVFHVFDGNDTWIIADLDDGGTLTGGDFALRLQGEVAIDLDAFDYAYSFAYLRTAGSAADDRLIGHETIGNAIDGGDGQDRIIGGDNHDLLSGGDGNDYIDGAAGIDRPQLAYDDDRLYGGAGNDTIFGRNGEDYITGGTGNDRINGGSGEDTISGGEGNDRIFGDGNVVAADRDLIHGDAGDDWIDGGRAIDTIYGDGGRDKLFGGDQADYLHGGADGDSLYGGTGSDFLYGEAGDDHLFGEADHDWLYGGAGRDVLTGGAGQDRFVFEGVFGTDIVTDFGFGSTAEKLYIDKDFLYGGRLVASFADVLAVAVQHYDDTVIRLDAENEIVLRGISLASLSASDFVFV